MRSLVENPLPKSATFTNDTIQSLNTANLVNELKSKKNLNLSGVYLSDNDAKTLFTALIKNDSIETVNLTPCKLNEKALGYLFSLMKRNKKIHTLIVNDANLTPKNIKQIAGFLAVNTSLKTLSLKNCHLGDQGIDTLITGFINDDDEENITLRNNTLETLDLENTGLGPNTAENLQGLLKFETNLRNLNLASNKLQSRALNILSSCSLDFTHTVRVHNAPFGSKITTLNLSHNEVPDDICSEVLATLRDNPRIHTFSMESDKYVNRTNQEVSDAIEQIVKDRKPVSNSPSATPKSPLMAHSRFVSSSFIPGKISRCRGEKGIYIFYPDTVMAESLYRAVPDDLKANNTIMCKDNIIFIANSSGGIGVYDFISQGEKQSAIQCTDNGAAQQVKRFLFEDNKDTFIRQKQKTETIYCKSAIFGKMPRDFNEDDFVNALEANKGFNNS